MSHLVVSWDLFFVMKKTPNGYTEIDVCRTENTCVLYIQKLSRLGPPFIV